MTVTLRTLRREYRHVFHPTQDWFEGEAFMDTPAPEEVWTRTPYGVVLHETPTRDVLPLAVELALWYVYAPDSIIWTKYLWCRDMDRDGQRVYLGVNGRGLEIHRHLHLTSRWCTVLWRDIPRDPGERPHGASKTGAS